MCRYLTNCARAFCVDKINRGAVLPASVKLTFGTARLFLDGAYRCHNGGHNFLQRVVFRTVMQTRRGEDDKAQWPHMVWSDSGLAIVGSVVEMLVPVWVQVHHVAAVETEIVDEVPFDVLCGYCNQKAQEG